MRKRASFFRRLGSALAGGIARIQVITGLVSAGMIWFMMLMIVADIILRAIFNMPLPSTVEISESAMVFIAFLAFGYTEATGGHIRVDILASRLSERAASWLNIVGCLVGMFFFSLILWDTGQHAIESWHVREFMTGVLPLPVYPAKFMVPLGCALLIVQFLVGLVRSSFKALGRGDVEQ